MQVGSRLSEWMDFLSYRKGKIQQKPRLSTQQNLIRSFYSIVAGYHTVESVRRSNSLFFFRFPCSYSLILYFPSFHQTTDCPRHRSQIVRGQGHFRSQGAQIEGTCQDLGSHGVYVCKTARLPWMLVVLLFFLLTWIHIISTFFRPPTLWRTANPWSLSQPDRSNSTNSWKVASKLDPSRKFLENSVRARHSSVTLSVSLVKCLSRMEEPKEKPCTLTRKDPFVPVACKPLPNALDWIRPLLWKMWPMLEHTTRTYNPLERTRIR